MALRLSELLERIRPAGAPGVASDGEQQTDRLTIEETVEVARLLGEYAAEADLEISRAREHAQQLRQEADRQSQRDRADLPDRLAAARIGGESPLARQRDIELARLADQTAHELDRLDAQAALEMPKLVEAAIGLIWEMLEPHGQPGGAS
jgi:hypothetical protein